MKMDIENCEAYALLGLQSLLLKGRVRNIVIESHSPLLLHLFYTLGYTCDIFDDFPLPEKELGESLDQSSGCGWPRNVLLPACVLQTYAHSEAFFRRYSYGSRGYFDVHCSRPPDSPPPVFIHRKRGGEGEIEEEEEDLDGQFVRIRNESFIGADGATTLDFDDEIFFLTNRGSFLISEEDERILSQLVADGVLTVNEISFTRFFTRYTFNPSHHEALSTILREAIGQVQAVEPSRNGELGLYSVHSVLSVFLIVQIRGRWLSREADECGSCSGILPAKDSLLCYYLHYPH